MSISKEDVSIGEVLGAYLSYTPTYTETEHFWADIGCLNHTLLYDAIVECRDAEKVPAGAEPQTKRQKIHDVYVRKIKELSSLYPFFFSVENALRALAGRKYHEAFGDPYWWQEITNAYENNLTHEDFPLVVEDKREFRILKGVLVNPIFVKDCLFVVGGMAKRQRNDLNYEDCPASMFYEKMTIKGLMDIISADYRLCSLPSMTKNDFVNAMNKIHKARNELYHSNPIKNRNQVFSSCERVLDAINFHLGSFDEALKSSNFVRSSPGIKRKPRHCIPPLP